MAPNTSALPAAGNRLDCVLDTLPQIVWMSNADGHTNYLTPRGAERLGVSSEAVDGWSWLQFLHPDDVDGARMAWRRAVAEQSDYVTEYRLRVADGTYRWFLSQAGAARDADGAIEGWIGTWTDIDDRKTAEADRDALIAELRMHVERMPLAYLRFDANLRIVEWNAAAQNIFGYSREEMLGVAPPYAPILPPDLLPLGTDILGRLRAGDSACDGVNDNLTKDGRRITCEWHNTPLFDAAGTLIGLVALADDITERRRGEVAMRESEERFRQIAESIREVFWLTTPDKQQVVYLSPAYDAIWGRSRVSVYDAPQQWLDAVHPDDRDRVLSAARTRQVTSEYDEEYRITRPDGSVRWIHDRGFPVRDADGRVVRVAGVAEDVTERRRLEEQLRQSQKMEAVGQLTGGIAHDFNNMLAVILGNGRLLLDDLAADDPRRGNAEAIVEAGDRAASLTRQLLTFSRRQVVQPTALSVNAVVEGLGKMLRRVIGEDIDLSLTLAPDLGTVLADPGELEQVIINLVVNARDAMPSGGRIVVETSNIELDEDGARTHAGTTAGPHVLLAVTDTGDGIPAHVRERIFEPFFTTKKNGRGTGLGLPTCYGIVQRSKGHISVYSEVGHGTVFKVYLPRTDAPAAMGTSCDADEDELRGTETILVVEDDEQLRETIERILSRRGYTVLSAASGAEAIGIAERHHGPVHLVLSDLIMPGMNGPDAVGEMQRRLPGIEALFMSGYTEHPMFQGDALPGGLNFIQKPFPPNALAVKLREVLES